MVIPEQGKNKIRFFRQMTYLQNMKIETIKLLLILVVILTSNFEQVVFDINLN